MIISIRHQILGFFPAHKKSVGVIHEASYINDGPSLSGLDLPAMMK